MSNSEDRLDQLQEKLDAFLRKQDQMQNEVLLLRSEIRSLKRREKFKTDSLKKSQEASIENESNELLKNEKVSSPESQPPTSDDEVYHISQPVETPDTEPQKRNPTNWVNFEKLVGENLINKIGIIITVIGVAIGSNYVIENDLISPLTRIILGYLFSFGLVGTAYRLKNKYLNYSAVIMGGAMASLYLVTFAAYSFYSLIPQLVTFILMSVITATTVISAIGYNKEWISIFGLVGGYAVPFLVGDNSNSSIALFSYILFINLGLLLIALRRYWRGLYYSAFTFTWLIFLFWFNFDFSPESDLVTAFLFSSFFFLIFYIASIAYKIQNDKKLSSLDISTILTNTFLFFGIGYQALEYEFEAYHGLFTVIIALIHFIAGLCIKRFNTSSPSTQNFLNGLVLVFLTLAIPIQLQDNWIAMAWSLEALLLIWMGRVKGLKIFEVLSYPVMFLAFFGLIGYWIEFQLIDYSKETLPFLNSLFGTFLVFWISFYSIQYLISKNPSESVLKPGKSFFSIIKIAIPFALIFTLYINLLFELIHIFNFWDIQTQVPNSNSSYLLPNPAIDAIENLWIINYSFSFLCIGTLVNNRWFKIKELQKVVLAFSGIVMLFFFSAFFADIKFLRDLYLNNIPSVNFDQGIWNVLNRYIIIGFALWNILTCRKLIKARLSKTEFDLYFDSFIVFTGIFILSTELIQWLDILGFDNSYKLGLSILWGICSLAIILYGILNKKRHLRVAAIVIFFITLIKLFFYDISHLSTISKTIVFLSLGILLLIISYLYNRFKDELVTENISSDKS